jgi:hypothetical protein
MNAKSKGLGLLAAVVLSLTMFGGAMAQNSDSEGVSATLSSTSTLCSIDIYGVYGGFGSWTDGVPSGDTTEYFYGDVYNYGAGCNIAMTFGGLVGPGGLIDTSHFSAYSYVVGTVDPATWGTTGFAGPYYDFQYTLNSVPSSYVSGVYSGSIVASITDAA